MSKNRKNQILDKLITYFFLILIIVYPINVHAEQEIIFGINNVRKEIFYESSNLHTITNIAVKKNTPSGINNVFIFSQEILQIVNLAEKNVLSEIRFDWSSGVLRPDVIFDGVNFTIISKGPVAKLGAMDMHGRKKWIFNHDSNILENTMTAGDLDKNGSYEFYVATNKSMIQLDNMGNKIWSKGNGVLDVEIFEDDKKLYVASVTYNNRIEYRDFNGNLIKTINPKINIFDIEFIKWPNNTNVLTYFGSKIYIIDQEGVVLFHYNLGKDIYSIKGVPIAFGDIKKPFIAILAKFSSTIGKSMLCIFTYEGKLFYQEIINSPSQGIIAIDNTLLVGNEYGKVFKYFIKGRTRDVD